MNNSSVIYVLINRNIIICFGLISLQNTFQSIHPGLKMIRFKHNNNNKFYFKLTLQRKDNNKSKQVTKNINKQQLTRK